MSNSHDLPPSSFSILFPDIHAAHANYHIRFAHTAFNHLLDCIHHSPANPPPLEDLPNLLIPFTQLTASKFTLDYLLSISPHLRNYRNGIYLPFARIIDTYFAESLHILTRSLHSFGVPCDSVSNCLDHTSEASQGCYHAREAATLLLRAISPYHESFPNHIKKLYSLFEIPMDPYDPSLDPSTHPLKDPAMQDFLTKDYFGDGPAHSEEDILQDLTNTGGSLKGCQISFDASIPSLTIQSLTDDPIPEDLISLIAKAEAALPNPIPESFDFPSFITPYLTTFDPDSKSPPSSND